MALLTGWVIHLPAAFSTLARVSGVTPIRRKADNGSGPGVSGFSLPDAEKWLKDLEKEYKKLRDRKKKLYP